MLPAPVGRTRSIPYSRLATMQGKQCARKLSDNLSEIVPNEGIVVVVNLSLVIGITHVYTARCIIGARRSFGFPSVSNAS